MVAIGVRSTGEKVLLSLAVMGVESTAAWSGFVMNLVDRGLKRIELAIVDGNKGLTRALLELWPNLPIQRCTVHKLWNILGHAPKSLQGEVKADYEPGEGHRAAAAPGPRGPRPTCVPPSSEKPPLNLPFVRGVRMASSRHVPRP